MKKVFYFVLFGVLSFYSCDDVKDALAELTVFDIDYETEVTVPATLVIIDSPLTLDTPTITTNSESRFENNNTRADLLEKVTLKSMALTLESPDDGSFDFLEEITLSMTAEGLERIEIASATNLENNGVKTLSLETTDADLKEYLKKDSFDLRITSSTDQTIAENHKIVVKSVFTVDAEIFGL